MTSSPELHALLDREHAALLDFVRREASGLLRFESAEDLAQGIHLRALASPFEDQGEERGRAWLRVVARRYVADRHDYWNALRRGSGRVLRMTMSDRSTRSAAAPATPARGPATFAERRELLEIAMRALHSLPERDRELVAWESQGVEREEQARRLELTRGALQRASHRAFDRFRKSYELLLRVSASAQA